MAVQAVQGDGRCYDAAARVADLVERLRQRGHRLTPQRLAVLRVLCEADYHPTAAEVAERLEPSYPMMSLATVYNTVDLLRELGEVIELILPDGCRRYDARTGQDHPHAICTRCGHIQDVGLRPDDTLRAEAARRSGYTLRSQRVDFYGLCPDCAAKESRV